MKHMAEASRVHLNCHREGVVVCPYCGHEKMLNMAHYRHYIGGKSLKGRCKRCCGSFLVTFDYRQHVRIPVDFAGQLVHSARQKSSENILITSLSVAGVGFVVGEASRLTCNTVIEIRFRLDDVSKSLIHEPVQVRRIQGTFVGAEYCRDEYRHALDFYVMRPHGAHDWAQPV